MARWRKPVRIDSFYAVLVRMHLLLLVLAFALFIVFATAIIFTRLDRNIEVLIQRAQSISWEEYNRFFDVSTSALTVLAHELESKPTHDQEVLAEVLDRQPAFDIWLMTDQEGRVLLSSADGAPVPPQLVSVARLAHQSGEPVAVTEIVSFEELRAFNSVLAGRAVVFGAGANGQEYGAMFQVAAVPFQSQDRVQSGALVAAHLLNNDSSIAWRVREEIPESFSTVSAGGLRIAGNLFIPHTYFGIGQRQAEDLIGTVSRGERYQGGVELTTGLVHFVVSDPIRNSRGEVIGALTTGHPSEGLATLKRDTALYLLGSAWICLTASLIAGIVVSKSLSRPLVKLGNIAKLLSEEEVIRQEHVDMFTALRLANTREIRDLQVYFTQATLALYEKNQEILCYLNELEAERNRLRTLTDNLQELNETLEARVEEKTLELRNAMLNLVELNKLKTKLLANTSHELRTPLNSVIGFSDMLLNGIYGDLTQQQRERIRIIGDSARYLLRLINDLLDMSMIAQGKLSLEYQSVDLHQTIASVVALIRHSCEQHQIQLSTQLDENVPEILADPTRIKQVLYNLLSNSVKFTPPGGEIIVRTDAAPGEVIVTVQDSGVGISEPDLYRVFDEFYQVGQLACRKEGGFGLGLPMAKKLVEAHGGRIGLTSAQGEGTTAVIHLPIRPPDKAPLQVEEEPNHGEQGSNNPRSGR